MPTVTPENDRSILSADDHTIDGTKSRANEEKTTPKKI